MVKKPNLQNIPVYCDNLHYQKSACVDIPQESYGKAPRSVESYRGTPYQNKKTDCKTLEDLLTSDMLSVEAKEGDCVGAMFRIARNARTERGGNIQEVLERRAKLYGDNLDPEWFSVDSDLGVKAKS